ncbi:MAG: methionine--tRNA ligase [Patescibacteria group bacterium]|jgi:methionyl-tRNA synthetase|nr:methionine--tRNA ligase [Patescibacteria group bacterium]
MSFYITTSIAYTNAPPHIGFALELLQADAVARYNRQQKVAVYFLTGTDEHGHKVAKKAEEQGKTPQQFVDEITEKYKLLTEKLNISNDDFIRTTDQERHWKGVYKMWDKLKESGDIYKKKYEGLYCVGCEAFKKEKELVDGKCPDHNKEPEIVKEENYFFRLSKYEKEIKKLIQDNTLEITPEGRKKEMLNFLNEGLEDISISRSTKILKWGIPVPEDNSQVLYVWVDALTNYISALGYGDKEENFEKYWPADIHFIGKDILRFHAVIWIGMLLSAGLQVPKKILSHGHITSQGKKMSKTVGNVVDPFSIIEKYGLDPVRYYLLSEIPTFSDGDFSENRFLEKYNSDLADGLGNLVSRVVSLSQKYESITISNCGKLEVASLYHQAMKENRISDATEVIWQLIHATDKYIEEEKPWEKKENSEQVVKNLFSTIDTISEMLQPILPETSEKIKQQLKTKQKTSLFPKK